jgi:hypothetical protein
MQTATGEKAAVQAIREEFERSRDTRLWKDFINVLQMIAQVVFTRSSGFLLELIQNAEDAGKDLAGRGEVSMTIDQDQLTFVHNGKPFDPSDLEAICGIRSAKKPERGTLGYLGIGFKSVFKVCDCVEVHSNGYTFKFDRNHPEWSERLADTPWHVIPIWMDGPSPFATPGETTLVLHLRDPEARAHVVAGLRDIRAELYLFLKWIKSIRITDRVAGETWSVEDLGTTAEGITTLRQDGREQRFKLFRREVAVPAHVHSDRLTQAFRANVTHREITVAFPIDPQGRLDPTPAAAMYGGVYSFVPLGESKSGAKFPIQADFLVQPGRDALNPEAPWNHWLLDEVADLCREAIRQFQQHPTWRYQYFAVFQFSHSEGLESYKKLFLPRLIAPIEQFLKEIPSVPTADGQWAMPSQVVVIEESTKAIQALTSQELLAPEEVAPVFGGTGCLFQVHPEAVAAMPGYIKRVTRESFLRNMDFLESKARGPQAPAWFRRLYSWLRRNPVLVSTLKRKGGKMIPENRPKGYHGFDIVLNADRTLSKGGQVHIMDTVASDPFLGKLIIELQTQKPMLHLDILEAAASDQARAELRSFLTSLTGVQVIDTERICRDLILPRITIPAPAPPAEELLELTRFCQRHLPPSFLQGMELWVVNRGNQVRKASELLFSLPFKPDEDWETAQRYIPGADFLSQDYVSGITNPKALEAWRGFFRVGGVKPKYEKWVELFGVQYAMDRLSGRFTGFTSVENVNFGYDLKAVDRGGEQVCIEVKGQTVDNPVELTDNEARTAKALKTSYYLCVVSGIPETPQVHLVQDPFQIGEPARLTIKIPDWKRERLE